MPFFTSPHDAALLHYSDYRPASHPTPFSPATNPSHDLSSSPVTLVFIHGWPMSSGMYEHLVLKLCETHRIRCIASDRRGFGKSEWVGHNTKGNVTYDTFASDTAALVEQLQLESFLFVAASMGCGETLLAYQLLSDELKRRCRGFLWMGPSLPFPIRTEEIPTAPPRELWDMLLQSFRVDRVGFAKAAVPGVFGMGPQFNTGIELPGSVLERFERIVGQADALAIERCVQIMTERDFTEDLKALRGEKVKVMVLHGDEDQGMPASCSANLIPNYVPQAEVKIFEKAAHGLYLTHAERVLEEIIAFVSAL